MPPNYAHLVQFLKNPRTACIQNGTKQIGISLKAQQPVTLCAFSDRTLIFCPVWRENAHQSLFTERTIEMIGVMGNNSLHTGTTPIGGSIGAAGPRVAGPRE
jgi:hypothetical protein